MAYDKYYNINLEYNKGSLNYIDSEIILNPNLFFSGEYYADLISFDNKLLNRTSFSVPNMIFYDIVDEKTGEIIGGGNRIINQTKFTISLPYYENAKEIRISKLNITTNKYDKILAIDVSYYAKEIPKSYKFVKENLTVKEEIKEKKEAADQNMIIYGFIGVILLLFVIVLYLIKRRND